MSQQGLESSINRAACSILEGHRKASKHPIESRTTQEEEEEGEELAGELPMALPVKIGPFGGDGGHVVDISSNELPKIKTLDSIDIWISANGPDAATVIRAIQFVCTETNGNKLPVGPWGKTTDPPATKKRFCIDTGSNDYLSKIEGMFHNTPSSVYDGGVGMTSLTLTTKQGHTQTFGNPSLGTTFSVPLEAGGFFAFFGKVDTYINALGFYAKNPYP